LYGISESVRNSGQIFCGLAELGIPLESATVSLKAVQESLQELVTAEVVMRTGDGKRGDPFQYLPQLAT
jgi:hypothetical protein